MSERHDVVIIGAGVVGCAIAASLARMGAGDVVLLEREAVPGSGSTAKANGGIRAQFTTAVNIEMSLSAMRILDELAAEIGDPPLYVKAGYLFVTDSRERLAALAEAAAFQRARGVSVELLDAAGVRRIAPWLEGGGLAGGTFGARDGFIDPGGLANWFLADALRRGARVRCRSEVTAMARTARGEFRIATASGEVEARAVVVAAGAWAGRVAALAGVAAPVRPVRRHIVISGPCAALPPLIPMTIDADTGVLVRRDGPRVVIAYSNPDEPEGFNLAYDPAFVERIAEPLERRFPAVAGAGIDHRRSWAGLYEVTPDHHAIIGEAPGVPGFYIAAGFSGHGVMHAPATGRCVAELILRGRAETADIAPLSPGRFARGALIHEALVL